MDVDLYIDYLDSIIIPKFVNKEGVLMEYDILSKKYRRTDTLIRFQPYHQITNLMISINGYVHDIPGKKTLTMEVQYKQLMRCGRNILAIRQDGRLDIIDSIDFSTQRRTNCQINYIISSAYVTQLLIIIDVKGNWFSYAPINGISPIEDHPTEEIIKVRTGMILTTKTLYIIGINGRPIPIPAPQMKIVDAAPSVRTNPLLTQFYILDDTGMIYMYIPLSKIFQSCDPINLYGELKPWERLEVIENKVLAVNKSDESYIVDYSGMIHLSHIPDGQI